MLPRTRPGQPTRACVTLCDYPVPGAPFDVTLRDSDRVGLCRRLAVFGLDVRPQRGIDSLSQDVTMPSAVGESVRRGGGGAPADAPASRYGALLRGFRARRGLSLRAVGGAAGLHPQELSRSEAGRRRPADEAELLTLADA